MKEITLTRTGLFYKVNDFSLLEKEVKSIGEVSINIDEIAWYSNNRIRVRDDEFQVVESRQEIREKINLSEGIKQSSNES